MRKVLRRRAVSVEVVEWRSRRGGASLRQWWADLRRTMRRQNGCVPTRWLSSRPPRRTVWWAGRKWRKRRTIFGYLSLNSINQSSFISGMTGQQCTIISKTHTIVQKFKSYVPNICLCTTFVWCSWSLTSVWWVMAAVVSVCDVWGCISAMQRIEEVLVRGGHG